MSCCIGNQITAQQVVVRRIDFKGDFRFDRSALREAMGLQEGKTLPVGWPDSAMSALLSWYHRQGYYQARIDSVTERYTRDSTSVDLDIWISEGYPVRVGRFEVLDGEGSIGERLVDLLQTRSGRVFSETVLKEDIEQILVFLENNGHPLGRVNVESLSLADEKDHPKIDIVIRIDSGPLVTVKSILVEGNRSTKQRIILREMRLKAGKIYRHREILVARENLKRLEYLQEVDEPEVVFHNTEAFITFRVKEGNASVIDGVLGYHPSASDEQRGYLTGLLQFTFRNIMGTGRFLEAYWEKKDAYSQSMRFGYEEPWLLSTPLHLGGEFRQEVRDTTYVERDWRFSVRYVPWPSLSMLLKGGYNRVLPDSAASLIYDLPETSAWIMALGIDYDTFDDPYNPRRGVRYHTTVTLGRKQNIGPEALIEQDGWKSVVNTRRLEADAEVVIPTFNRQNVYFGLHATEVRTGDRFVPLSHQVRFGGARTLRGYAEDAFRGTLVAWINAEYRFLLGRHSRIFVFVDGGTYQRREEDLGMLRGTKIGYGFGLRLETRLGLIGIDYGLGEGDSPMQGKVHVGLLGRF